MNGRFLDVRRLYRPMPASPCEDSPRLPERPVVLALQDRVAAISTGDSSPSSIPDAKVLTFVRPNLSEPPGFMAPPWGAMNLQKTNTATPRAETLEAAYLLLIERAGTASFRKGPEACAAFVSAVLGELSSDDPHLEDLRRSIPDVKQAEALAADLVASRCAACPVEDCERSRA